MAKILCIGTSHTQSGHDFHYERNTLSERSNTQFRDTGNSIYTSPNATEYFYKTWPGAIEKLTGHEVINLGVPGIGIDGIVLRVLHAIDYYTPDLVFIEIPPITRNTFWPKEIVDYNLAEIYNISHVVTSSSYHNCSNCELALTIYPRSKYDKEAYMSKEIFGTASNLELYRDTWLYGISDFAVYSMISQYKFFENYCSSKGIKFLSYNFTYDVELFDQNKFIDLLDVPTCRDENNNIQYFYNMSIDAGVFTPSTDGRGHASYDTEQWIVSEHILPHIEKIL